MLNTLFVSRRIRIEEGTRQEVKTKQDGLCSICQDKLGTKFEVDHISPLCQIGTNDVENLRAICPPCHSEETDKLLLAGMDLNEKAKFHTIESHLSPKLYRELHLAPKPKEVSYGVFEDTRGLKNKIVQRTRDPKKIDLRMQKIRNFHLKFMGAKRHDLKVQNIKDLLQRHQRPEKVGTALTPALPSHISQLKCMDAVGCRLNALIKRTRGLPVFSPLDEWEPFSMDLLPLADFVFIQVDGRLHEGLFPYTGSRAYAAEVCEYMLEHGIIREMNCKAILRSTRHIPSDVLEEQLDIIDEAYRYCEFKDVTGYKRFTKGAKLAMIGLWNANKQHSYKQFQGYYEIDAGPGVTRRRRMEDGSFIFTSSTELVGLYSMAPWGGSHWMSSNFALPRLRVPLESSRRT